MELTPVTCSHCGASIQVPDSARFVTCRYCNSQLEIKRTESSITTEVLQQLDRNTAAMAEDLHAIRRETELERLDREWNERRDSLLVRGRGGNTSVPTVAGGLAVIFIMGGFGLFWTIMAAATTSGAHHAGAPGILPCAFPLFGVLFIALAIFQGVKTITAAGKYQDEESEYQRRRQEVIDQNK